MVVGTAVTLAYLVGWIIGNYRVEYSKNVTITPSQEITVTSFLD